MVRLRASGKCQESLFSSEFSLVPSGSVLEMFLMSAGGNEGSECAREGKCLKGEGSNLEECGREGRFKMCARR